MCLYLDYLTITSLPRFKVDAGFSEVNNIFHSHGHCLIFSGSQFNSNAVLFSSLTEENTDVSSANIMMSQLIYS